MSALSFVNPLLLWGLAAASIPLIIHLLFRRRFRRVDWAPMVYLKLSIQRNRRRIRLEQLLLLLCRTALVVLLFLLVARPVLHAAGWEGFWAGSSRASQILVIDDSLSMGHEIHGRAAYAAAQDLVEQWLGKAAAKDRVTVLFSSAPTAPLVGEAELAEVKNLPQLVREHPRTDSYADWEAVLAGVEKLVDQATYPLKEVTIVSDLRRAGWQRPPTDIARRWAKADVKLRIYDVGAEADANLSLDRLEQTDRLALVGAPLHWQATVHNRGTADVAGLDAEFIVDGKPTLVRVSEVAAGGSAAVGLEATFDDPGLHYVSLKLPDDALAADNQRWSVAAVRESVHMVLVDGEPSSEPLGGEADFLALALSLGVGEAEAYKVDVITDAQWANLAQLEPDLVVLANVASLTPGQADQLHRLVAGGMGLLIFVGDQLDLDNYNQHLYRGGAGLLPAELSALVDEEVTGLLIEDAGPSPLEALLQLKPAVLERVRIGKLMQVQWAEAAGTRVLARWNNAAQAPAAIEKVLGRGRVLLWTTTADKASGDWPTEPSYVMAVREAAAATARAETHARSFVAGETLRRPLAANSAPSAPRIEVPGGQAEQSLAIDEGRAGGEPAPPTLIYEHAERAGLYRLGWQDAVGGPQSDLVAVNFDVRESDLARMSGQELAALWQPLPVKIVTALGAAGDQLHELELWRPLATLLLGMLAVESLLATWVGRQR